MMRSIFALMCTTILAFLFFIKDNVSTIVFDLIFL